MNFYKRFIKTFFKKMKLLSSLLKEDKTEKCLIFFV